MAVAASGRVAYQLVQAARVRATGEGHARCSLASASTWGCQRRLSDPDPARLVPGVSTPAPGAGQGSVDAPALPSAGQQRVALLAHGFASSG